MRAQAATIYPTDALAGRRDLDVIAPEQAPTLDAQFLQRVKRSGDRVAYTDYDFECRQWRDYSWEQIGAEVARWQLGLKKQGLQKGDHVGIRLRNCLDWVIFDQAALGLGLVVVPLYVADRPENVSYVIGHAEVSLLLIEGAEDWRELLPSVNDLPTLQKVLLVRGGVVNDPMVSSVADWLPEAGEELVSGVTEPEGLASIVYTSGTTGRPKGVMLSHKNMVSNAYAGLRSVAVGPGDTLLSFLPLSHMLERTAGYYLPLMAGARIAFARSIPHLADDFMTICPTGIITVPRIFERLYSEINDNIERSSVAKKILFSLTLDIGWKRFQWQQGRGKWGLQILLWPLLDWLVASRVRRRLGGRLRLAVVGGAPLPLAVSMMFIPLGIILLQGYGLTESSPTISLNTLEQNDPESIGLPVHGVEVRIGDNDELLAKGPNIMLGYWRNDSATDEALVDGWLRTGDQARISDGFIFITGRIKDILVLANGEKIAPADMEAAIAQDPLFEQSMVIGEKMPFLSALVVLHQPTWQRLCHRSRINPEDAAAMRGGGVEDLLIQRIRNHTRSFPGYAAIRRVTATLEPWTIENGLITPTLKLKRAQIRQHYEKDIALMYEGHETFGGGVSTSRQTTGTDRTS